MAEFPYLFNKESGITNTAQLFSEIQDSSITIALDRIDGTDHTLTAIFKAALSGGEFTTLSGLVVAHVGNPNFDPPVFVTAGVDPVSGKTVLDPASPRTPDGELHVVASNFGHITGNKVVNWTMQYTLNAGATISERLVVPSGQTLALEFMQGHAPTTPFNVELNWFDHSPNNTNTFFRRNPAIRIKEFSTMVVSGSHTQGDNTIQVNTDNGFLLANNPVPRQYGFINLVTGKRAFIRANSLNAGTGVLTLNVGIPFNLPNNSPIALVDRQIARIGGAAGTSLVDFEIPPSFDGDGFRYMEMKLQNTHASTAGVVFAMLNGWMTSTLSGTIPGAGGGAEDEN